MFIYLITIFKSSLNSFKNSYSYFRSYGNFSLVNLQKHIKIYKYLFCKVTKFIKFINIYKYLINIYKYL